MQLAIVPAIGEVNPWNRGHRVVRGELQNHSGATETQGWYSADYADATAAPVLVYNAHLDSDETRGVFAWLLLPSPVHDSAVVATANVSRILEVLERLCPWRTCYAKWSRHRYFQCFVYLFVCDALYTYAGDSRQRTVCERDCRGRQIGDTDCGACRHLLKAAAEANT